MLGKAHSSSSSSIKRREFFSMYASTALVETTGQLLRNLGVHERRAVPLLPSPEPSRRDQLARMVGGCLRRSREARQADSFVDIGGLGPLGPRHGRDHLFEP